MNRYNDIEREFERFEAEIEQIPAPAQPKPKTSAFMPPQLRSRLTSQPAVRPPPPPPPAPPGHIGSFSAPYQPLTRPTFHPATKSILVRPNVVIEAKPIRYGESDDVKPVTISPEPAPSASPSDALARAKSILSSLKIKTPISASIPPSVTVAESVQLSLSKQSSMTASNSASAIPMPLNMPAAAPTASAPSKKASTSKQSTSGATASEESDRFSGTRKAGGQVWTDMSLFEWDPNDHRLFCGDLGNETTDDSLGKVFSIYPSFQKAKVIRDKRTNKTRGFGFVSFKDAQDLARAIREMNGKYVGNRPIKLRKSQWKDRNIELVKKKEKSRKRLGLYY